MTLASLWSCCHVTSAKMAFGFSGQQDVRDCIAEPVDAEVRILSWRSEQSNVLCETKLSRFDEYILEAQVPPVIPDSIKVRGIGSTTLFGLSSRFDDNFPSSLTGKVAVEEYQSTINRLNELLHKSIPLNLKCLLVGCLCCCCTLGLSFTAAFYLNKRTRSRIDKLLEMENWRLYNKLGLNLRLHCEQSNNNNLREHVLLIEFLPKVLLFRPD